MWRWTLSHLYLPILNPLIAFLLLSVVGHRLLRRGWLSRRRSSMALVIAVAGAGALLWCALLIDYLRRPMLYDHVEATLAVTSWAYRTGLPLYHDLVSSPDRYALVYGPLCYLANAAVLSVLGPSLLSAKLLGPITMVATLAVLYLLGRRWLGGRRAWLVVGLLPVFFLPHTFCTVSNRPDGPMMLAVALALALAWPLFERGELSPVRALLVGVCMGLAVACKLHGGVYFLPILAALWACRRRGATALVVLAALPAASGFFLIDGISAPHYLQVLTIVSRHPLAWDPFVNIVTWEGLLLLPLVALARRLPEGDRPGRGFALGLVLANLLLLGFASKAGAGRHHVLPMLPCFGAMLAWLWRQKVEWSAFARATAAAALAVAFGFGARVTMDMMHKSESVPARAVLAELTSFYQHTPAREGMVGYAESYDLAPFRLLNVFAGARPSIEGAAEMDFERAGLPPPPAVFDRLRSCPYRYWLIPKGEVPFSTTSLDREAPRRVFAVGYQEAFFAAYGKTASLRYFDVWRCRRR